MPIVNQKSSISVWGPLIQKVKNKIHTWSKSWLNLARKVVLIKSNLSSFPIFSCALRLAPKEDINSLSIEIRKILWEGGKTQGRKFNLVKWESAIEHKSRGELRIRDLGKMNNALGDKLVWMMIFGRKEWWVEAMRRKYIKKNNTKCLETPWIRKSFPLHPIFSQLINI